MPVGVGAKPQPAPGRPPAAAAKPAAPPTTPPAGAEEPKKRGGAKIIIIVLVILVLLAGLAVGVLFLLKTLGILGGGGSPEPTASPKMVLGEVSVSTGEPININLKDGFLSFAATVYFDDTVQATEGGDVDASPARDAAYQLFKGMDREMLSKPGAVLEMQKKYASLLNKEVIPPYNGHVVTVRFTQFAYQ